MSSPKSPPEESLILRVPASSSNLGSGFDLLGLALSLWLEVRLERVSEEPSITFSDLTGEANAWPRDQSNLLTRALFNVCPTARGLSLRVHSEIPTARGLGSSGAAVAAGLLLGNALSPTPLDATELFARGIALEGHPENVSASLWGGLTLSHPSAGSQGQPIAFQGHIHPELGLVVAWPSTEIPTPEARGILPRSVDFDAAVENPRRLAILLEGLRTLDSDLIRAGLVDHLHERYRLPLIPGGAQALRAARATGAMGACISGSGSALVALGAREHMQEAGAAMADALGQANREACFRVVQVVHGAPVLTTDNR